MVVNNRVFCVATYGDSCNDSSASGHAKCTSNGCSEVMAKVGNDCKALCMVADVLTRSYSR